MVIEAAYPCDVCGDSVEQCSTLVADGSCEGCFDGDHDNGICLCCSGVICGKHTAETTCPHQPINHETGM